MASKKRKPNEPVPEQLATADTVGNTDQDDGTPDAISHNENFAW